MFGFYSKRSFRRGLLPVRRRWLREAANRRLRVSTAVRTVGNPIMTGFRDGSGSEQRTIPVMRPQLPPAERILPYLKRVDESRIYSNFGPLVQELQARLATRFGLDRAHLVTAGSGLAALVGGILGAAGRAAGDRPLAVVPAYTFSATAAAVELCGYQPWLEDVDPQTWQLDPASLLDHPLLERIGLVVPVAAFGRAVQVAAWSSFHSQTGIPVVVDGAASFEGVSDSPSRCTGAIPVAISFHATKSFGTGEGGCLLATDEGLIARSWAALNQGRTGVRDCSLPSTNGRMNEYNAAVGLAELDGWSGKRTALRRVAALYHRHMTAAGLVDRLHHAPRIASCYVLYLCRDHLEVERVTASLAAHRVDYRYWYGGGLHQQTYYAGLPRRLLTVTDDLAQRLLGLPVAPDLSEADVIRVVRAIRVGVCPEPALA